MDENKKLTEQFTNVTLNHYVTSICVLHLQSVRLRFLAHY